MTDPTTPTVAPVALTDTLYAISLGEVVEIQVFHSSPKQCLLTRHLWSDRRSQHTHAEARRIFGATPLDAWKKNVEHAYAAVAIARDARTVALRKYDEAHAAAEAAERALAEAEEALRG